MKKSKPPELRIAFALRQAWTGKNVNETVRKLGTAEQTFYRSERSRWEDHRQMRRDGGPSSQVGPPAAGGFSLPHAISMTWSRPKEGSRPQ